MRICTPAVALTRLELLRTLRGRRIWLGLAAAAAILVADSALRPPEARSLDSLFMLAFAFALITGFRTGWAEDRIAAFDELLVPALVPPRDYFLSRVATAAVSILFLGCIMALIELTLSRDGRSATWLATYGVLAAWLFSPAALWAEYHSRLRWPMVFPWFFYVAAAVATEPVWGSAAVKRAVGLSAVRSDFGSLLPGLWRGAIIVPLLFGILYLHAFRKQAARRGSAGAVAAARGGELSPRPRR